MEGWMIQIFGAVATLISAWAIMRHTVNVHDKKIEKIEITQNLDREKFQLSLSSGVKRFEELGEKITVLQQTTNSHLDLKQAEDRFVSHKEMSLHIANIENSIKHIEKQMETANKETAKKLDYLTELLSTNLVKSVIPHGQVFRGE